MKVLIVGLGSIASKHMSAIKKITSDVRFYALRSSTSADEKKGVVNIFSWEEIGYYSFDFAIISNPSAIHAATVQRLIPFGLPLFIEKPIFTELKGVEILEQLKAKKIKTYIACNLRFLESIQFIKKYLSNRRINEVNIYCGSYLPDWRPKVDFKKSYSASKQLGGGVHIDLIHEIDYAQWLFGKPDEVLSSFSSRSSLGIEAYDYAHYLLGYSKFKASIILNYFRRDSKRTLEIVFEDHTIKVDLLQNKVFKNDTVIFASKQSILNTYENQMSFFINEIITNGVEFNTAHEAYETLKICLQRD
ncbi:MAG: Gfo/Idh/MocA family oxidoreductase [Bacteroidota bacterium]